MVVPRPPAPLHPGGVRGQHQVGGRGLQAKQGPVASGDPPLGQAAPAVGAWPVGGSEGAVSAPGAAHPAAVDPADAGRQVARVAPVWPPEAWREASLVPCDAGGSSGGRPGGVGHSPCRLASYAARTWWTWAAEPRVHPRGAPADSTPAPPFSAAYNWGRLLHHAPGMPRCLPSPVGLGRGPRVVGGGRLPACVAVAAAGGRRAAAALAPLAGVGRSPPQRSPPPPPSAKGGAQVDAGMRATLRGPWSARCARAASTSAAVRLGR